jgi:poly(3-hydroxybutyrate) depolymerase/predicted RNA methylase
MATFKQTSKAYDRRGSDFALSIQGWMRILADSFPNKLSEQELNDIARRIIIGIAFLWACEGRGIEPKGQLKAIAERDCPGWNLLELLRHAGNRYKTDLFRFSSIVISDAVARDIISIIRRSSANTLGFVYECLLNNHTRKRGGVYYTPAHIVDHVVNYTVGASQTAEMTILDPACGAGHFLVASYRHLTEGRSFTANERERILKNAIYGIDIDPIAVEVTKLALLLELLESDEQAVPDLSGNIKSGDALCSFDWFREYPDMMAVGGFDVVIGNPPWGQKAISCNDAVKKYLWKRYPSSKGIFDLFRPFVELGIELTKPGGVFGMVLPDIILLKDYPDTRRYMLDNLRISYIDWWGMAFSDAVIDAATIIGIKGHADDEHIVQISVHDEKSTFKHDIPQIDFRQNLRYAFNLYLTPEKRHVLMELEAYPKLGDYFEIHEGVHSGNIRSELFVDCKVDNSCRELIFGRDEISPYRLTWAGRYVRLSAAPLQRTSNSYANVGRPEWYDQGKVLVRRTGDHVLAAVDREYRYASNNFFMIFPKASCSLALDGLSALLNSRFMTWYFQTIEPRKGRVFSELKIKHLAVFPLPKQILEPEGCRLLNSLGAERSVLNYKERKHLDLKIDAVVEELFGVTIPNEDQKHGDYSRNITIGGYERRYIVHMPESYDGIRPAPLVVMLHGAGGTAEIAMESAGWTKKADQEGFIVVFPEALRPNSSKPASFLRNTSMWNDGSGRGYAGEQNVDDSAFIKALINDLQSSYVIDFNKIFITGFSNGASMAFRLGVELSDIITAIAPMSGYLWLESPKLAHPVSLFLITGTADPLNPFDGGNVITPWGKTEKKPSMRESVIKWAEMLGCDLSEKVISDNNEIRTLVWSCNCGAEALFCSIEGQGHIWPGGEPLLNERIVGKDTGKLNATDAIWEFFKRACSSRRKEVNCSRS